MVEAGSAFGSVIAEQAMKMLFALEGDANDIRSSGGTLGIAARSAYDAERLELLDCLYQELKRCPAAEMQRPEREACLDLLAHLSGRGEGWRAGVPAGSVH